MTKTSAKQLSSEQTNELLSVLKTRFIKNINRHIGVDWVAVEAKLKVGKNKLWSLNEMERTGGEPDVLALTQALVNTFFMIARRKVLKPAEVFVMIVKLWNRERKISPKATLWIWQLLWALNF